MSKAPRWFRLLTLLLIHALFLTLAMTVGYWAAYALEYFFGTKVPPPITFLGNLAHLLVGYFYGFAVWRNLGNWSSRYTTKKEETA